MGWPYPKRYTSTTQRDEIIDVLVITLKLPIKQTGLGPVLNGRGPIALCTAMSEKRLDSWQRETH